MRLNEDGVRERTGRTQRGEREEDLAELAGLVEDAPSFGISRFPIWRFTLLLAD